MAKFSSVSPLLMLCATSTAFAQVTFTRWDFNAPGLSATSPAPALANQGVGLAMLIGGTAPGITGPFLSDVGSTDPLPASAWSISSFPSQGSASGTAGIEFRTSAAGYAALTFELDMRPTGTFSDFYRVEYSLDQGQSWTSFTPAPLQLPGDTGSTVNIWIPNVGAATPAFTFPAAADGLADVRVRLVTVFSPALGNAYAPNSPVNGSGNPQPYLTSGSIRVDMVEFKGSVSQGLPPTIDANASSITPGQACAGIATPVNLDVRITPGSIPASTSANAWADTTSIGGGANIPLAPAGVDGNGRLRFTLATSVASGAPTGPLAIPVLAIDNASRSATGTLWLNVGICCYADLDNDGLHANGGVPDGGVDINDLLFFLSGFEAGATDVDLDNDGDPASSTPDGGVDINDLLFFLARFESGC
jgi:hypothetical protein